MKKRTNELDSGFGSTILTCNAALWDEWCDHVWVVTFILGEQFLASTYGDFRCEGVLINNFTKLIHLAVRDGRIESFGSIEHITLTEHVYNVELSQGSNMESILTISEDFRKNFIPLLAKSAKLLGFHFDQLQTVNESIVTAKLNLFIKGIFRRSPFAKLPQKRSVNETITASSFYVNQISSIGNLSTSHRDTRLLIPNKEDCAPPIGNWFTGVSVKLRIQRQDDPAINNATLRFMTAFTRVTENELIPFDVYTQKNDGYFIQKNGYYETLLDIMPHSEHSVIDNLKDYMQNQSTDVIPSRTIDIEVHEEFCSLRQRYHDIVYRVAGPVVLDKANSTNFDCPPGDHNQYKELKKIVRKSLHKTIDKWHLYGPEWMKIGILYCSENNTLMAEATMLYTWFILQEAVGASNEEVLAPGQPWYEKSFYRSLENYKMDEVYPFSLLDAEEKSVTVINCDKRKSKLVSNQTWQH